MFLHGLPGKKIGAPARGSIHDIIIRHLLHTQAVAGATVVNYPWADLMPQAIADGEIAAAVGTPPLAAVAQAWYGHSIIIPPGLLWPFNPSYGIIVHAAMLKERGFLEGFIGLHEQACNLYSRAAARGCTDSIAGSESRRCGLCAESVGCFAALLRGIARALSRGNHGICAGAAGAGVY